MLDLRHARVDYTGGLLAPPDGFHFESAVATTYSLDLGTLLSVLLPLALGGAPDAPEACSDGLLLLRALWRVAPRLTVFHQAGQIPVPHRATPLHALLDRILVPVALPPLRGGGRPPAFHPKTWTLEYRNAAGESRYRFIVLSRNLTRDDSLDIALALESGTDRRQTRRTAPLLDFLAFLGRRIPPGLPHAHDHARRIAGLSKGLSTHPLVLGTDAVPWGGFDLFPLYDDATRRALFADPLFSGKPGRVVAMSPFLSASVVGGLVERADAPLTLLTRPDACTGLDATLQDAVETWALKYVLATPEPDTDTDSGTPRNTDLHAKLYLRESPSETALLLGSMNATESGLRRNVEMMIRLRADPHDCGCRDLLRGLFGKKDNPFERLLPGETRPVLDERAQADREAAQTAIDVFCRCGAEGRVEPDGSRHAIVVEIPPALVLPPGIRRCTLQPLAPRPISPLPARSTLRFGGLALAELSPLFVFGVETPSCTLSRVVRIPLDGLDEPARDAAAAQAVVEANGGWSECLGMFFSPTPFGTAELRQAAGTFASGDPVFRPSLSGLYENMLRTAAEPGGTERFAGLDIDSLLARQTEPEALRARELLALFRQVLHPKTRSSP